MKSCGTFHYHARVNTIQSDETPVEDRRKGLLVGLGGRNRGVSARCGLGLGGRNVLVLERRHSDRQLGQEANEANPRAQTL